jgi:SAM-dependent methyltransferase
MAGSIACPVCAAGTTDVLARIKGAPLRRCADCGHRFLETATPSTNDVIYNDHYAGFREDPVFRREAARVVAEELLARRKPPARLLDVGCGNGEFLTIAREAGFSALGVDVSPAAGELCHKRGLEVRIGDVRSTDVVGQDERFDLITFWDVVEHLVEPVTFLARAHALLADGGYLLVKTPATSEASVRVAARVPRVAGALLSAPSHVQYFERHGLNTLLRRAGFGEVEFLAPRPMRAPATGGSLRRRVTRRAVRLFLTVAGDHNLLALARKAETN